MKMGKIFWGISLILISVFLLLDAFGIVSPIEGVVGEISLLSAVLGIGLVTIIICSLLKLRFYGMFVPAALLFMLFERNIAFILGKENADLANNWTILLVAVLLTIGVGFLGSPFRFRVDIKKPGGTLGKTTVYIDAGDFESYDVKNKLGSCEVHFENVEEYVGGGVLNVENQLGQLEINLPSSWRATVQVNNSLGNITEPAEYAHDAPEITIVGENNLGNLEVRYV